MADFDINDRTTWDWVYKGHDEYQPDDLWRRFGTYAPSQTDPHTFFQKTWDSWSEHHCPPGRVFNPTIRGCDKPESWTEELMYDWAVKNELVRDQR